MVTTPASSVRQIFLPSSWQWPLVMLSYCLLIHAFIPFWTQFFLFNQHVLESTVIIGVIILGVSGFFGWKAREPVTMDAAIVALLYAAFTYFSYDPARTTPFHWVERSVYALIFLWGPALGFVSAAAGRLLHEWRLRKNGIMEWWIGGAR